MQTRKTTVAGYTPGVARPLPAWLGIVPLSALVATLGVGLLLAIDLWTLSVTRAEARRALRVATQRTGAGRGSPLLPDRVSAELRGLGLAAASGDVAVLQGAHAVRVRYRFEVPGELSLLAGTPRTVEVLVAPPRYGVSP